MNDQKKYLLPAAGIAPAAPTLPVPLAADLTAYRHYLTAERGMAQNTIDNYGLDLMRFARWVAAGGLADYLRPTLAELIGYAGHMQAGGLAPSSRGRHVAAIKGLYRFLRLEGRTSCAVVDLLESPTVEECLPHCLSVASVAKLLEAPGDGDRYPLRDRALLETMYASGCRVSEVLGMRLADVLAGRVLVDGKGSKQRLVLLGGPANRALAAYVAQERPHLARLCPPLPFVFLSQKRHDGPMMRIMAWHIIRRYAERVGLHRVHPHVLRHSFATHMLAGGADIRVIQELLGHSKITTTQKYAHVDMTQLQEAHRQYHPRGK